MLTKLKAFFRSSAEREMERAHAYLAESSDLIDLEWRMRELDRQKIRWHL